MSAEAMAHVFRCSPYPGTSKEHAVLLAVADTVSDLNDNRFWMGQSELARKSRVSKDRVGDALKRLTADGWIVMREESTPRTPAIYELVIAADRTVEWEPRRERERRARAEAKAARDDAQAPGDEAEGGDAQAPGGAPEGGGQTGDREGTEQRPRGDAAATEPKRTQGEPNGSATPRSAAASRGEPVTVDIDGDQVEADPGDPAASFEVWWSAFPRHPGTNGRGGGGSRKVSAARWTKLSTPKRAAALAAIGNYRAHLVVNGYPPMYAEKWLSQERWQDFAAPPPTGADGLTPVAIAVAAACRIDVEQVTGQQRGDLVIASEAVTAAGGTPDTVRDVAGRYRKAFDGAALTPAAIVKHWARFTGATDGARSTRVCPRCRQPITDRHDDASCSRIAALFGGDV